MASRKSPLIWAGGQTINPQQHVNFKKKPDDRYTKHNQTQRMTRGRGKGQPTDDSSNEYIDSSFKKEPVITNESYPRRFNRTFRDSSSEEASFSNKSPESSLNRSEIQPKETTTKDESKSIDSSFETTKSLESQKSPRVKMVVENNKVVYKVIEDVVTCSSSSESSEDSICVSTAKNDLNPSNEEASLDWCLYNLKFEKKNKKIDKVHQASLITEEMRKGQTLFEDFPNNSLLIHGLTPIPKPIKQYSEIRINQEISNPSKQLTTLQSYMLTSVLRGLDVCMIGPNLNVSYLLPICDLALEKSAKYGELSAYNGPLIILLTSSLNTCETTTLVIKNIYKKTRNPPIIEKLSNNSCDILITTPKTLINSLKSMKFNLQRLCHLIIDDACAVLDENHEIVVELMILVKKMFRNRPHNKSVQFILASLKWSKNIEILLKKFIFQPLICIDNYFEACLYGQVQISRKTLKDEFKKYYVEDKLGENKLGKSVIFCVSNEIEVLSEYLRHASFSVLELNDDSSEEDIMESENFWNASKVGTSSRLVLVCTDKVFDRKLEVNDAVLLIHYSLPNNWEMVVKRFRCLLRNSLCPLIQNQKKFAAKCYWLENKDTDKNEDVQNNFFSAMTRSISPRIKV